MDWYSTPWSERTSSVLWIQFACVSTNYTTHKHNIKKRSVRSSASENKWGVFLFSANKIVFSYRWSVSYEVLPGVSRRIIQWCQPTSVMEPGLAAFLLHQHFCFSSHNLQVRETVRCHQLLQFFATLSRTARKMKLTSNYLFVRQPCPLNAVEIGSR